MTKKLNLPFISDNTSYDQLLSETIKIDSSTQVLPSGSRIKHFEKLAKHQVIYAMPFTYAFHCFEFDRSFRKKQSHFFIVLSIFAKNKDFREKFAEHIKNINKVLDDIELQLVALYPEFNKITLPSKTKNIPIRLISELCAHWFCHIRKADFLFGRIRHLIKQNILPENTFYTYFSYYRKIRQENEVQKMINNTLDKKNKKEV